MRSDDAYLADMLMAARRATTFSCGLTYSQFEQSELHQNAILNVLQVVGEGASCVRQATKDSHPEIPWIMISGLRNRIVHGYFAIDFEIIWRIVQDDLLHSSHSLNLSCPGRVHSGADENRAPDRLVEVRGAEERYAW